MFEPEFKALVVPTSEVTVPEPVPATLAFAVTVKVAIMVSVSEARELQLPAVFRALVSIVWGPRLNADVVNV
jgi:hypothetical protein